MISRGCNGRNLLNHLNQKEIEYTLNCEQLLNKNNINYYHWKCTFNFNGKSYIVTDIKKKECIEMLINEAKSDIYNYIF